MGYRRLRMSSNDALNVSYSHPQQFIGSKNRSPKYQKKSLTSFKLNHAVD